ncbi:hypothetical protein [Hafnia alvei]|uniref:hypothetical protein n=1 Tax=Hafnia alvei TaxID=569 RepID=UPI00345DF5C9
MKTESFCPSWQVPFFVCLGVMSITTSQAERDPFHPLISQSVSVGPGSGRVLGVIGDGRCWRVWVASMNGNAIVAVPLFSPRSDMEDISKTKAFSVFEKPAVYPFSCPTIKTEKELME